MISSTSFLVTSISTPPTFSAMVANAEKSTTTYLLMFMPKHSFTVRMASLGPPKKYAVFSLRFLPSILTSESRIRDVSLIAPVSLFMEQIIMVSERDVSVSTRPSVPKSSMFSHFSSRPGVMFRSDTLMLPASLAFSPS